MVDVLGIDGRRMQPPPDEPDCRNDRHGHAQRCSIHWHFLSLVSVCGADRTPLEPNP
jgi:hypothetical protein